MVSGDFRYEMSIKENGAPVSRSAELACQIVSGDAPNGNGPASGLIKAIRIHDFGPGLGKVRGEFRSGVALGIDLGNGPQL